MTLLQKLFGFGKPSLDTRIRWIQQQVKIQGEHGNWNCNAYMHGMFNGLECALATLENRPPEYRNAPTVWLDDLPARDKPEEAKNVVGALSTDPNVSPYVEGAKVRLRSKHNGRVFSVVWVDGEHVTVGGTDDWKCRYSIEEMFKHWEIVDQPQTV